MVAGAGNNLEFCVQQFETTLGEVYDKVAWRKAQKKWMYSIFSVLLIMVKR
jgi:hypothetical protein